MFPPHPKNLSALKETLEKLYKEDIHFEDGLIFNSTWTCPLEIAVEAHLKFIESNLGNPLLYPGTSKMHDMCVKYLSSLLNLKEGHGKILSGGTESNITALWIARKIYGKGKVLYPETVHISVIKAIDLLNLEGVKVSVDDDFRADIGEVEKKLRDDVIAVVLTAGTTLFGTVDPIKEISELLDDQFLHVDGAFGGFILPFMEKLGLWKGEFDFRVYAVKSFSIDPHKMGMSTIPSGALITRDDYFRYIRFEAEYLSNGYSDSLLGTRCSAAVAATYAAINYLGYGGYKKIVKRCFDVRDYALKRFEEEGLEILHKPPMTIVNLKFKNPKKIYKKLLKRRVYVSLNSKYSSIRLVFMPHIDEKKVDLFIENLKAVAEEEL